MLHTCTYLYWNEIEIEPINHRISEFYSYLNSLCSIPSSSHSTALLIAVLRISICTYLQQIGLEYTTNNVHDLALLRINQILFALSNLVYMSKLQHRFWQGSFLHKFFGNILTSQPNVPEQNKKCWSQLLHICI